MQKVSEADAYSFYLFQSVPINCQSKFVMTETNNSISIVAIHKIYTKILFSKNSENKRKLLSSPLKWHKSLMIFQSSTLKNSWCTFILFIPINIPYCQQNEQCQLKFVMTETVAVHKMYTKILLSIKKFWEQRSSSLKWYKPLTRIFQSSTFPQRTLFSAPTFQEQMQK